MEIEVMFLELMATYPPTTDLGLLGWIFEPLGYAVTAKFYALDER